MSSRTCTGGAFELTEHCCRHCGGRVLQAGDTYRCSTCRAVTMGAPDGICGCGILPNASLLARMGPGRFRCGPNPAPTDECPSEIVVLFGEHPAGATPA